MRRFKIDDVSLLNIDEVLDLEWLDTNGTGGYASSTIIGCNTRKYHGLLVANLHEPKGRHVLLSWLEDSIISENQEFFISCCQYPNFFFPSLNIQLTSFELNEYPSFNYIIGHLEFKKSLMMLHGKDVVLIRYDIIRCPSASFLSIKPFLSYRGYNSLSRQNPYFGQDTLSENNKIMMSPYNGMPSIYFRTSEYFQYLHVPIWHKNFEYKEERNRGYDYQEDLFRPGIINIPIKEGKSVIFCASLNDIDEDLAKKWDMENRRRLSEAKKNKIAANIFKHKDHRECLNNLIHAGRQFVVKNQNDRPSIIAGYHWFTDWGRDTLISLPGLTFCSGRPDEGVAILIAIGQHEKDGLLPNYFSDNEGENPYNTVDASLLYFWATQQMLKYTGLIEEIKIKIWPVMKRIIEKYMKGTLFNIHMNDDGLLFAGGEKTHLTWMDAVVGGKPVTSRHGFAVEINALWYNAICFADELARTFDEPKWFFHHLISQIKESFTNTFWINDEAYLGDVFYNGILDKSVRPNQIMAVSLSYSPLTSDQQRGVVNKIAELLLTPFGLRTLSPTDNNYKGKYGGNVESRDNAYHQGTVWPWLMGHFGEAYLKVSEDKKKASAFLLNHIRNFVTDHMHSAGIGCISEVFDGDPPHRPNGCISQAWSTAELIRLYTVIKENTTDVGRAS